MEENNIQVLIVNPGEHPEIKSIPNTLEAFQRLVGGYIETVALSAHLVMVVNEEGKLLNLEHNFKIPGDSIVGPAVFCGTKDCDFASLSHAEAMQLAMAARSPEGLMFDNDGVLL